MKNIASNARLFFALLALPLLPSCVSTPPRSARVEYETVSREEHLPSIDVSLSYPQFTDAAFSALNEQISSFAERDCETYRNEAEEAFGDPRNPNPRKHSYELTILKTGRTETSKSVVLKTATYTGGAHYNYALSSFSLDSADGTPLSVTKASGMTLDEISSETRRQLLSQGLDADMVRDGTAPDERNFSCFVVSENTVTVYFEPYQVASFADGIRTVELPRK